MNNLISNVNKQEKEMKQNQNQKTPSYDEFDPESLKKQMNNVVSNINKYDNKDNKAKGFDRFDEFNADAIKNQMNNVVNNVNKQEKRLGNLNVNGEKRYSEAEKVEKAEVKVPSYLKQNAQIAVAEPRKIEKRTNIALPETKSKPVIPVKNKEKEKPEENKDIKKDKDKK